MRCPGGWNSAGQRNGVAATTAVVPLAGRPRRDEGHPLQKIATIAVLLLGVAGAARAQDWADFAPYPGSVALCDQRVYGNVAHLHWTAFTVSDAPEAVVAFYADRLGKPEIDQQERIFRVEKNGIVERVLSVYPVTGRYPRCGKDPDASARTVVIASRRLPR